MDPKAAEKILALTKQIIEKNHMTCMMITHNLHQALQLGNRTIMMSNGRIISDLSAEEKKRSSVEDLMQKFHNDLDDDRILLREE